MAGLTIWQLKEQVEAGNAAINNQISELAATVTEVSKHYVQLLQRQESSDSKLGIMHSLEAFMKTSCNKLVWIQQQLTPFRERTSKTPTKQQEHVELDPKELQPLHDRIGQKKKKPLQDREPEHFLLKVESFSVLCESTMEKYESEEFEAGGHKWKLILYPKGDKHRNGSGCISLYLSISDTKNLSQGWEMKAYFSLYIYNNISDKYITIQMGDANAPRRFHGLKTEWGFSRLVALDEFKKTSNGYIFNDTCVFGAEVFVISSTPKRDYVQLLQRQESSDSKLGIMRSSLEAFMKTCCNKLDWIQQQLTPFHERTSKTATKQQEHVELEETELQPLQDREPEHSLLKVESFSVLCESTMEKYESEEFEAGGHKWKLILYPKGDKDRNGSNHISLYLSISDAENLPQGWEVKAHFSLYVYNNISDKYLTFQMGDANAPRQFHRLKTEWGFSRLVALELFKKTSNGYIFNDTCVFGAEVFVISSTPKRQCLLMIKETGNKTFTWKVDHFSTKEEHLDSLKFKIGDLQWKLVLYPKGHGDGEGKSITLFLEAADDELTKVATNWKAYAEFKLRIRNQVNTYHFENRLGIRNQVDTNHVETKLGGRWFSKSEVCWGCHELIPLSDVNDKAKGFVQDDTLIVEAEITMTAMIKNFK